MMKLFFRCSLYIFIPLCIYSCTNDTAASGKTQSPGFISFVKNFDTLSLPLILSYPGFMKENAVFIPTFKRIDPNDLRAYMKMDSAIPYPVYYYGQLPMRDSTYYLINYFEMKEKKNPSMWWTLMKFDYFGALMSETNVCYCVKDSNNIDERFCKIMPNYQCFYVETKGKWDAKKHTVTDTVLSTRTINLMLDQHQ
jgi:hypothetical protein